MKRLFLSIFLAVSLLGWASVESSDNIQYESELKTGKKLYAEGKYHECLKLINIRISHKPKEKKYFSKLRLKVLKKLGYYKESLNQMLGEVKGKKVTSINTSLEIGGLYMNLKDLDNTFKWYNIAVDNGFTFFPPFEHFDDFKPIRNDIRFHKLMKRMKDKIGLGKPIKHFEQKDISGKMIYPGLFKNTVLLIDFWATWCPPCMAEMQNLKDIYKDYNKKGFAIVAISLDSDKNKLDRYVKEFSPPWPVIFSGKGFSDEIVRLYNVKDIPSVWLVDRKGKLRHLFLNGKALREAVKTLINEKGPT
jgi:thiol-disulfide isomerase/thioredoxin